MRSEEAPAFFFGDNMGYEHIVHGFEPIYDRSSRVLILGSLPSVRSREQNFYYGHPQNRFWRVIASLCGEDVPQTISEKTAMLLRHGIAVWDVVSECDIIGSSDASLKNVVPTDIRSILDASDIQCIYVNGGAASRIFDKYQKEVTGCDAVRLPSTSPANAAYSLERLISAWSCITAHIK